MSTGRNKAAQSAAIEALASRIQLLPREIRWLHSQQEVIQAIGCGFAPYRGPWSRCADHVVRLADALGIGRQVAVAISFFLLLLTFASQLRTPREAGAAEALFVGIRAMREPSLVQHFERVRGLRPLYLDERDLRNFTRHRRPSLRKLLRELRAIRSEVWLHLRRSNPPHGVGHRYLLSAFMLRAHKFAYFRAWFREYLREPQRSPTVAFATASLVPCAALAVGGQAVYFLHGFQRRSLIFPEFSEAYCFNRFDGDYIRSRLPNCSIKIIAEPTRQLKTRRAVAIASGYCERDGFHLCRSFVEWAHMNGLPVIVRKHPMDASSYWEQWRRDDRVELVEKKSEFSDFLAQYRPRFLATWYSTTLFDALCNGIVPVTFTQDGIETADTVFPIRKLCLCWPEHQCLAQSLLDDPKAYTFYITSKQEEVIGASHDEL